MPSREIAPRRREKRSGGARSVARIIDIELCVFHVSVTQCDKIGARNNE